MKSRVIGETKVIPGGWMRDRRQSCPVTPRELPSVIVNMPGGTPAGTSLKPSERKNAPDRGIVGHGHVRPCGWARPDRRGDVRPLARVERPSVRSHGDRRSKVVDSSEKYDVTILRVVRHSRRSSFGRRTGRERGDVCPGPVCKLPGYVESKRVPEEDHVPVRRIVDHRAVCRRGRRYRRLQLMPRQPDDVGSSGRRPSRGRDPVRELKTVLPRGRREGRRHDQR